MLQLLRTLCIERISKDCPQSSFVGRDVFVRWASMLFTYLILILFLGYSISVS